MRSGSSRGVYLRLADVPPPGQRRDAVLRELIGSPGAEPVDGLGGGTPTTSKIMAVGPSEEADADVVSFYAEVHPDTAHVDYSGNCGNLSAGVGVFAVEQGWVEATTPVTDVTCRNLNTGQMLRIAVPTDVDGPGEVGDHVDAGVVRPAAAVDLFFSLPHGGMGRASIGDPVVELSVDGIEFRVTMLDVGAPQIIVAPPAGFLDLTGSGDVSSSGALNASPALLDMTRRLRRTLLDSFPALSSERDRQARYHAAVPRLAFAGLVPDRGDGESDAGNIVVTRAMSADVFHPGVPVSSAIAVAAATRIRGGFLELPASTTAVRLRHSGGELRCLLDLDDHRELRGVGVTRSVRRIMAGTVFARALDAPGADDMPAVPVPGPEAAA